MKGQINPKIVGSTILGFAIVAGAYTVSNFGEPKNNIQSASVQAAAAPERVSIAVTDNNNNGIEDWRDQFVTTEPLYIDKAEADYTPPDTVTGKMSINFMESIIRSKGYGEFGRSEEEVINRTVDVLSRESVYKLYDAPDITIMDTWDDEDAVNYFNTVAATIAKYNNSNLEGELEIIHDIVNSGDQSRMTELKSLAQIYKNYRDDTLKIPVPATLAKAHLDLINSFSAIHNDISAMTLAFDDPAVALVRLKRYQDDATGLAYAMQNMFFAAEPYAAGFDENSPAILFVFFSPDYQI